MARQEIPVLSSARAGVVITQTTGHADGMKVLLATYTMLRINNTAVASRNVTFVTTQTVDGLAVADRTEAIAAGEAQVFGIFPLDEYALPDTDLTDPGYMYITPHAGNETDLKFEAYTPADA